MTELLKKEAKFVWG
jgi:hypothetical protein